jgi:hypothetical protein
VPVANAGGSDDGFQECVDEVVVAGDPVPEAVLARARDTGRTCAPGDSELLDLVYDSIVDRTLLDARGDDLVRLLTFAGGGLRLDIRLDTTLGEPRFSGWTAPLRVVVAQLRTESGTSDLTVERDGTIVARGRERVAIERAPQCRRKRKLRNFHTSWFSRNPAALREHATRRVA